MTEDEIKSLAPDGQPEVEVVTKQPDPPAPQADDEAAKRLRDQMKALEETAAAERQGRLEAERRAHLQTEEARRYQSDALAAGVGAIDAAIESSSRQREIAEREYETAMEVGEFSKAAKAQTKVSEASAELVQLRRDKAAAEANIPKPASAEGRIEYREQPYHGDPVEAFISSATPASQTWLRQHREFIVRDGYGRPALDRRLLAAHTLAVETDGQKPDTPDYFAAVEKYLMPAKQRQTEEMDDNPRNEPASRQRAAPIAAPVSRDPPASNGQQPRQRIQLTKEQVEAAHMFGDPKKTPREREIEYWNNMKSLESEGRIGDRVRH